MKARKTLSYLLTILVIFFGITTVKADISINTNGGAYQTVNCSASFANCTLTALYKQETKGNIVYCAVHDMAMPKGGTGTYTWTYEKEATASAAIGYIFEKGLTTNGVISTSDYMINQFAVWYFVDKQTFDDYFTYNESTGTGSYKKGSGTNTDANAAKVIKLINEAKKAKNGTVSLNISATKTDLKYSTDRKYYISEPITITPSKTASTTAYDGKISLSLTGLTGAFITTDSGATSGSTSLEVSPATTTIYIKVPVSSVSKTSTLTLKGTVKATNAGGDFYKSTGTGTQEWQKLVVHVRNSTSGSGSETFKITINDTPTPPTPTTDEYPVNISKKSITGADELPGAKLVIKDSKGTTIETWESTAIIHKTYLEAGTYTLEETIAPVGYIKSTEKITFTVTSTGKITIGGKEVSEVVMTNKPLLVYISKRSINGKTELPGATLKITDKDGNILKDLDGNEMSWKSTTEQKRFRLGEGTYYLSESIPPTGYELSDKTIEFTVDAAGQVKIDKKDVEENTIIFTNTPEPEEVQTGSFVLYIILIGSVSVGLVTYFTMRKTNA